MTRATSGRSSRYPGLLLDQRRHDQHLVGRDSPAPPPGRPGRARSPPRRTGRPCGGRRRPRCRPPRPRRSRGTACPPAAAGRPGRTASATAGSASAACRASAVNPGTPSSGSARRAASCAWVRPSGTVTSASSGGSGSSSRSSIASSNDELSRMPVAAGLERADVVQLRVPVPHRGVGDDAGVGQDLADAGGAGALRDLDQHLLAGPPGRVDLALHPGPGEPAGHHAPAPRGRPARSGRCGSRGAGAGPRSASSVVVARRSRCRRRSRRPRAQGRRPRVAGSRPPRRSVARPRRGRSAPRSPR